MKGPRHITRRRKEVLHWMARGKTNIEIGAILNRSPRTIGYHVQAIGTIYGCPNRMSTVMRAIARGDIPYESIVREFA